ncbi:MULTISPECIES: thiamine phosphate synthase [Roseobacteraceae]|jgi:thiamine-phosphate pyrophosphorylase|uniref:Thiamine-phosphate synthase n=1 Tax=Pseudosulfitobacter pseudonitzschiae TaxID=1402135 RepID=A0A221K6M5_9RHOB|nr:MULTISPECIES: thiamine phosphate synthase [Roseobacteraceae]ASM74664.1 thiamine-phosphate synthase [Pseudosulfitobacter pseudonitzschiae]
MTLDRFYPIFDRADWIERLVPLGIKLVQLRIKDASPDMIRAHVRRAQVVCVEHGCTLVLNDHWRIAIETGCDWLHLGQEDLDDADLGAIRTAGLRLGISTHDRAELARAILLEPDYIALGPIYPTILKQMKWHQQGTAKLTTWRNLIGGTPLVAIGGMSVERATGAFDAGADVVSAVTDITLNDSPEDRVAAWLAVTR